MNTSIRVPTHQWPIDSFEARNLVAIQHAMPWQWTITAAKRLSFIAEHAAAWLAISVILLLIDAPHRREWMVIGIAVLVSHLVSSCIKILVRRSRPTAAGVQRLGSTMSMLSFPSSHSANTAAFATGVALIYPVMLIPGILLVAMMGIARMRLGVHYPSDVLAGVVLGTSIATLGFLINVHLLQ